jgi:sulfide:quinone oxidoreductase
MGKRVIILGGGIGGLVVANRLRKGLTRENEIVLVDKEKDHLFAPSLLWLMVGLRKEEQIKKPLIHLQKKGIKVLNALVEKIDFANRKVSTSTEELSFDYLVLALGASTFPEKVPGLREGAYNLYDLEGAEKIRDAIAGYQGGRMTVLVSSVPFKCPAAPYEAALLLNSYFKERKREVEIEVMTPEQLPMGVAGPEVGNMVVSLLQKNGIRFTPQYQVTKIRPKKREIAFQDGTSLPYDFLIGIPPHGAPPVLNGSPVIGESGWVHVNPRTLETNIENVYALGDVTSIPLSMGKPLPKAGVFAHYQSVVVAHEIEAKISGLIPKKEFEGNGACFIELGGGKAGFASGNFYAEPEPVVHIKKPSRLLHWKKLLFEKWWFRKWF